MRNYETIFILKPTLEEATRNELINKFTSIISAAGEVVKIEEWGNRKLAYEIEKFRDGYYVLVNFKAAPSLPMELERNYRIADDVIRYMIVNLDEK